MASTYRINLAVRDDVRPWLDFASGLNGGSATEYINGAIRRDRDGAAPEVREAYEAFLRAREASGAEG